MVSIMHKNNSVSTNNKCLRKAEKCVQFWYPEETVHIKSANQLLFCKIIQFWFTVKLKLVMPHYHFLNMMLLEFFFTRHFDSFLMKKNYFCLFRCYFWISIAWFTQCWSPKYKALIFTKDCIISQLKVDFWTCNFTVILFLGKWIHGVIYQCEVDFDMCTMYVMAGTQWQLLAQNLQLSENNKSGFKPRECLLYLLLTSGQMYEEDKGQGSGHYWVIMSEA